MSERLSPRKVKCRCGHSFVTTREVNYCFKCDSLVSYYTDREVRAMDREMKVEKFLYYTQRFFHRVFNPEKSITEQLLEEPRESLIFRSLRWMLTRIVK